MERIHEPARELDVIADADVVVIGGGPGGFRRRSQRPAQEKRPY